MKIDFAKQLKYVGGVPMVYAPDPTNKKVVEPLTLRIVCINSLGGVYEQERGISEVEKIRRRKLAEQIFGAKELDLKSEDIALLKKLVHYNYQDPFVYTEAIELLENSAGEEIKNETTNN